MSTTTTVQEGTKTITLRTSIWDVIARALSRYHDEGSQRGEEWDSDSLQSVKARFKIAFEDATEVKK